MLEMLFGWGSQCFLVMTLSKMTPGSGMAPGCIVLGATLLAYGVPCLPRSGCKRLLNDPSAERYLYCSPRYESGGCWRSFHNFVRNPSVIFFPVGELAGSSAAVLNRLASDSNAKL